MFIHITAIWIADHQACHGKHTEQARPGDCRLCHPILHTMPGCRRLMWSSNELEEQAVLAECSRFSSRCYCAARELTACTVINGMSGSRVCASSTCLSAAVM